jgi:hypothetical protein
VVRPDVAAPADVLEPLHAYALGHAPARRRTSAERSGPPRTSRASATGSSSRGTCRRTARSSTGRRPTRRAGAARSRQSR